MSALCRCSIRKSISLRTAGTSARVPYGVKSVATIEDFTRQIAEFLLKRQVKALIIACNTMAAVAAEVVRQVAGDVPVLDVIDAGARSAVQVSQRASIAVIATPTLLAPHLYKKAGYDTTKDFTPVATVYDLPIVVVVNPAQMPSVTDVQKLITHAKARPGQLNYTSSGAGSFGHLSMELLKQLGGFEMQHVPYKGGVPAITDTIGGQVPLMYADLVAALPHIQAGKLRAIAVGSPQRVAMLPDVKTIAEQGFKGYEAVSWGGLMAPPGTPKAVVDRIAGEVKQILADKEIQDKLLTAGAIAAFQSPDQMAQRIKSDYAKWGAVIRDKGISNE